jgi:hypothetical protein
MPRSRRTPRPADGADLRREDRAHRLSEATASERIVPALQCLEQEQEAMDPKVIEMNNLRVLNDYLNQTLDVLVRGQRFGAGHTPGVGYSPFMGSIPTPGTDGVWGPTPFGFGGSPMFTHAPFGTVNPFSGLPLGGAFGSWQQPWQQQAWGQQPWTQSSWTAGQMPWTPGAWPVEAARQAQVTQTLAAKQSVLEAICRACGIPV